MQNDTVIEKICSVIDKLRPFLINDGGDLKFVKFENGIVYVKMTGACAQCEMIDVTLRDGIEEIIVGEIPEVTAVEKID